MNSDIVSEKHCKTSAEFIAELSPRCASFPSPGPGGWIFRGHGNDEEYKLVPSAFRGDEPFKEFGLLRSPLISHSKLEWAALRDFLETSDHAGLHIPEDTQFVRAMAEPESDVSNWPLPEVLPLMALAQHNGVPTRLLDWSRNPMKAALFAAIDGMQPKNQSKGGFLSVWALSLVKLDMIPTKDKPFAVVTVPSASNSNLRAQEGLFTLAQPVKTGAEDFERKSFDEQLSHWIDERKVGSPGPWFHRVILPRSEAEQLRFDLSMEGVNESKLFPDFGGVVASMKSKALLASRGPGRERVRAYLEDFSMIMRGSISSAEFERMVRKEDPKGKLEPPFRRSTFVGSTFTEVPVAPSNVFGLPGGENPLIRRWSPFKEPIRAWITFEDAPMPLPLSCSLPSQIRTEGSSMPRLDRTRTQFDITHAF